MACSRGPRLKGPRLFPMILISADNKTYLFTDVLTTNTQLLYPMKIYKIGQHNVSDDITLRLYDVCVSTQI